MGPWLICAGKYGEDEQRFVADPTCDPTWEGTEDRDLRKAKDHDWQAT